MKIPAILLLCISSTVFSQDNYSNLFQSVITSFRNHYIVSSLPNDSFTENFTACFTESLDPFRLYLSKADWEQIRGMENSIRTEENIYAKNRQMLTDLFRNSLIASQQIIKDLRDKKLDFSKTDSTFPVSPGNGTEYYERDRLERWEARIKFLVLQNIFKEPDDFERFQKNRDSILNLLSVEKNHALDFEERKIRDIMNTQPDFESYVFYRFINSYITGIDPHGFFFSSESFSEFREELSAFEYSYGIKINEDPAGKIVISALIPGSYAWRSGKLHVGDVIVSVETGERLFKLTGKNDISEFLEYSGTVNRELKITVSRDNRSEIVTLFRERTEYNENKVQGWILEGEHRSGYISLPAFYTSWESDETSGCAQDVAKTIYELKKQHVQSLILDLRNNGGGSIREAIELAGIFIDFGTLSVSENKTGELVNLKDMNRGTLYSGPLAIIVNENSASASEMVAAVLQDYNRAVVTGEKTYGKASGQILIPAATSSAATSVNLPMLKVTTKAGITALPENHTREQVWFRTSFFRGSAIRKTFMNRNCFQVSKTGTSAERPIIPLYLLCH